MTYDYKSTDDIASIENVLKRTSHREQLFISAFCLASGLMQPAGLAPRFACAMAKWAGKGRPGGAFQILAETLARPRNAVNLRAMFSQTFEHFARGTDANDKASAGGWNEEEFARFLTFLQILGLPLEKEVPPLKHADEIIDELRGRRLVAA